MKKIEHIAITSAMLVSSTRAEDDYAAWSNSTTYPAGARCISTTTHRIYVSQQAGNLNHDPTTDTVATWWLDDGPTNRWAMFDQSVGSVTSHATPLTVVLEPGIIDSLYLGGLSGTTVNISMTDGAGGPTVYSKSFNIGDTAVFDNLYDYFFAPIIPRRKLVVRDLPPYYAGRLTVTVNAATTAECGTLKVGRLINLGETMSKPGFGVVSYSKKVDQPWGVDLTPGPNANSMTVDTLVARQFLDYVAGVLESSDARVAVWIADDSDPPAERLIVDGYLDEWDAGIDYGSHAVFKLSLKGLT